MGKVQEGDGDRRVHALLLLLEKMLALRWHLVRGELLLLVLVVRGHSVLRGHGVLR